MADVTRFDIAYSVAVALAVMLPTFALFQSQFGKIKRMERQTERALDRLESKIKATVAAPCPHCGKSRAGVHDPDSEWDDDTVTPRYGEG